MENLKKGLAHLLNPSQQQFDSTDIITETEGIIKPLSFFNENYVDETERYWAISSHLTDFIDHSLFIDHLKNRYDLIEHIKEYTRNFILLKNRITFSKEMLMEDVDYFIPTKKSN